MLPAKHTARIGRMVKKAMKLRGGGSALPGLVVEKINPQFLAHALSEVPQGVVLITGTNGKTTTTKMVAQLLRAEGLVVFTNPSGSNFTRGIVASMLPYLDKNGKLMADIAVLELDEAYAVHFVKQVAPKYSLILNVFRDQLDRFGEIDYTTKLLTTVVEYTTKGVVLNRNDTSVRSLATYVKKSTSTQYFGYNLSLEKLFPSDEDLHGKTATLTKLPKRDENDVELHSLHGRTARFVFGNEVSSDISLKLDGVYNVLNVAAALTLVKMILGKKSNNTRLLSEAALVKPAFGRGEAISVDGAPLEIILVKNPSGFRLALKSYLVRPAETMVVINDNYADGRDMSWLWDVNFEGFQKSGVTVVSGIRAYDMALRLQYEAVPIDYVDPKIARSLNYFLQEKPGVPKRIFCTYTAMLAIRRSLAKKYPLEPIE